MIESGCFRPGGLHVSLGGRHRKNRSVTHCPSDQDAETWRIHFLKEDQIEAGDLVEGKSAVSPEAIWRKCLRCFAERTGGPHRFPHPPAPLIRGRLISSGVKRERRISLDTTGPAPQPSDLRPRLCYFRREFLVVAIRKAYALFLPGSLEMTIRSTMQTKSMHLRRSRSSMSRVSERSWKRRSSSRSRDTVHPQS